MLTACRLGTGTDTDPTHPTDLPCCPLRMRSPTPRRTVHAAVGPRPNICHVRALHLLSVQYSTVYIYSTSTVRTADVPRGHSHPLTSLTLPVDPISYRFFSSDVPADCYYYNSQDTQTVGPSSSHRTSCYLSKMEVSVCKCAPTV